MDILPIIGDIASQFDLFIRPGRNIVEGFESIYYNEDETSFEIIICLNNDNEILSQVEDAFNTRLSEFFRCISPFGSRGFGDSMRCNYYLVEIK